MTRWLVSCVVCVALGYVCPLVSAAQERAASAEKSTKKSRVRAKAAKKKKSDAKSAEATPAKDEKKSEPAAPDAATSAPASPLAADEPGEVKKEGDTEVKVLEFTGLDIEGQLKTPQMLYFLNRLRAEFGRPRMPHRSFMPELQRSTQEKDLR